MGHYLADTCEGAKFWLSVITDLKNRGVKDILIACTDGLTGFSEAVNAVFPQTIVQRCVIHAIRNSLQYIPNKLKSEFMEYLKPVYQATTKSEAEEALEKLSNQFSQRYPMAVKVWSNNWDSLSTYFNFSKEIRKLIYTTNPIESYNSVLRKYTKNKRSFASETSLLKVLYLATEKASEKWDKSLHDWPTLLNQLAIHFDGRITINI